MLDVVAIRAQSCAVKGGTIANLNGEDAHIPGNRLRGLQVVTSDHHDPDVAIVRCLHRTLDPLPRRIHGRHQTQEREVVAEVAHFLVR